ncbi:MAG TPA: ATP-binding protein [Blastocatellia bacterium]|nr:ATP-binding protein [Blastocatellia bacterium]
MITRLKKLEERLLGAPKRVESLVRNVLFLGFFVLLLLVVGVGYRAVHSVDQLERESVFVDDIGERHLRLVLDLWKNVGEIVPESRIALANQSNSLVGGATRRRLNDLRREMDLKFAEARSSSLADWDEWSEFEAANKEFWTSLDAQDVTDRNWSEKRDRLVKALDSLDAAVDKERIESDEKAHQMSAGARKRIVLATGAVLIVGIVVAGLALYEIRRNLLALSGAYAGTAEARDYLQSLLDSLVSGVVVIGQDGIVKTVSESFRVLPVVGAESQSDQDYRILFRDNPSLLAAVSEQLDQPVSGNRYYGRVDLGVNLFDVFTSPLMIAGQRNGIIVVFVDVTETARAQTELRRNRALAAVGQMTAQIAHEIKNPLGSIRFATEFLKRLAATNQASDLSTIEVIERSVDHLREIVAQLSEFARPKELNRTEINVNALLDELLPMVADRLNAKQMLISRQYNPELPAGQYDGTELRKLFLNLIINAVEASEPNSSVELRTNTNGDGQILVDIIDHGCGMDSETLKRLFEPFYTTKEKGTGLGMAIAKQIAELHSGDLGVRSRTGEGTTATVKLPLTKFAEADNKSVAVNRHIG